MASKASVPGPITLGTGGWFVGPGFLALAAWFLWGPDVAEVPIARASTTATVQLSTAPRRQALGDPPVIRINAFDRTCMECHRIFQSDRPRNDGRLQHAHISLDHGIHVKCDGCHDREDRDRLALEDGRTIGFADVVELCAQCHGSIHHDWSHGMHGRTNGYWDAERGKVARLGCTECHDPHNPRAPAMDPLEPLPAPNTLRMGHPMTEAEAGTEHSDDPLRRAILRSGPDESGRTHEKDDSSERTRHK